MAKTQKLDASLPGDVIQITEPGQAQLALMIVVETRRTYTRARLAVMVAGAISWSEYRVQPGSYEVVGVARAVEAEIAKARAKMVETLKGEG